MANSNKYFVDCKHSNYQNLYKEHDANLVHFLKNFLLGRPISCHTLYMYCCRFDTYIKFSIGFWEDRDRRSSPCHVWCSFNSLLKMINSNPTSVEHSTCHTCDQSRPRSECASFQSDQDLHQSLLDSLVISEQEDKRVEPHQTALMHRQF
jgi:hypothetical protein